MAASGRLRQGVVRGPARQAVDALVDALVPSCCDGCGARSSPPWCATCAAAAFAGAPSEPCPRCAGPDRPGHACWVTRGPVAATTALTAWRDPVSTVVTRAKLAGRGEVFEALGRLLGGAVAASVGELDVTRDAPPVAVVPVPTDRRRARQRGLDHAVALALGVGEALELPTVRALRPAGRLPDRGRQHPASRTALAPGSFVPTAAVAAVAGHAVLLVDDVTTTGGTLLAGVAALRRAGVERVDVAVVARAGVHELGVGGDAVNAVGGAVGTPAVGAAPVIGGGHR